MKILWFANTPCSANEILYSNYNRGGWLSSLESELINNEEIELNIAFYYNSEIDSFVYKKTHYYPIFRKNSKTKLNRLLKRLSFSLKDDNFEIKQLLEIVNIVKPDLIHIHGTEENFGLIQSHIEIPVIISIQGIVSSIVEKFFSGITYFSILKHTSLKNTLLVLSPLYDFKNLSAKSLREKKILKECNYIIGRTQFDKTITRLLAPKSYYYHCDEILRSQFYKNIWGNKNNSIKRIFSVLGEDNYKGYETILKTIDILSNYINNEFEWIVAGLNKSSTTVRICKKTQTKSHDNLILKGNLNETEVVNCLLNSDIFCQVSHIENSSNSTCEAMILGLPIVASMVGGTNTLITHEVNGLLVQDGEPYILAGTLFRLLNNVELAKELGENARKSALDRHNKKKIHEQMLFIYKDITYKKNDKN
jgi:glycosyltransferase involved in cell wall biosynthesis